MSLDIGIGENDSFHPLPGEPSLALEDDGYYLFLVPAFTRLWEHTGQAIDPYGDAAFSGRDIRALRRALAEARALVEQKPETWIMTMGTTRQRLKRQRFLELLDQWDRICRRAQRTKRRVVCFGD
jgi:hypothetical protein